MSEIVSEAAPAAAPAEPQDVPDLTPAVVAAEHALEQAIVAADEPKPGLNPDQVDAILDAWVGASVFNSPVARNVDAINYFTTTALPLLRQRLKQGA